MFHTVHSTQLTCPYRALYGQLWKLERGKRWDEVNKLAEQADEFPGTLVNNAVLAASAAVIAGPSALLLLGARETSKERNR